MELKSLISLSQNIFYSLGSNKKKPVQNEKPTINFAFSSISSIKDIKKGEKFTERNIFPIRPSGGDYTANDYEKLLGKTAKIDIKRLLQIKKKHVL